MKKYKKYFHDLNPQENELLEIGYEVPLIKEKKPTNLDRLSKKKSTPISLNHQSSLFSDFPHRPHPYNPLRGVESR